MSIANLVTTSSPAAAATADVLVLGVRRGADGPELLTDDAAFRPVAEQLGAIGATGGADEIRRLPAPAGTTAPLALIGLGATVDTDALRNAAGAAIRQLPGVGTVAIALPVTTEDEAEAVLTGAAVASYSYTAFRTSPGRAPASDIGVHVPDGLETAGAVRRAIAVGTAIHTVRDLVNCPPNVLSPAFLADAVPGLVGDLPIEVEVLDEDALAAGGYGGILGVGSGSTRPPRLVVARYAPAGATKHLSLVGKGITFDSGGLSLKPAGSMVGMKYDMTGAATVLAVLIAAARLELPVAVTARLCIAENLPSGSAIRPNDVLTMRGGATVEVLNTDAEGRLVLADGLVDASAEHPDVLVDVATLTGAARTAMGERTIPVMGDADLIARVVALGAGVGEPLWHMPMPAELRSVLDSDVADLANAKPGAPAGGMLVAAHFLAHFVGTVSDEPDAGRIPWLHVDIAGTANNGGGAYGMLAKGPTGASVRTLVALAADLSRA